MIACLKAMGTKQEQMDVRKQLRFQGLSHKSTHTAQGGLSPCQVQQSALDFLQLLGTGRLDSVSVLTFHQHPTGSG